MRYTVGTGLLLAALTLAGCGGPKHAAAPAATTTTATVPPAPAATTTARAPAETTPAPLQAEANSAASGDIPDNQVFIGFHDAAAGYSMRYPEGWAQQGAGPEVTFRDKNNIVRVVVRRVPSPRRASIVADLARLRGVHVVSGPARMTIGTAGAWKVTYTATSAPNPVTGKRVTLVVDRYYLTHAGKEAIVDLGTPQGVDNVDAYRLMVQSFRWR